MKKHRLLLFTTIIFFLLINTCYFWEGWLGVLTIPVFVLLGLLYLILAVAALAQLIIIIREKLSDKKRLKVFALLATCLILIFLFPNGIIPFEKLESNPLLVAYREGVASCMCTLKLRENKTYLFRETCFGIDEETGDYTVKGDTVFFDSRSGVKGYHYAVIKGESILLGPPKKDGYPFYLAIKENDLLKK